MPSDSLSYVYLLPPGFALLHPSTWLYFSLSSLRSSVACGSSDFLGIRSVTSSTRSKSPTTTAGFIFGVVPILLQIFLHGMFDAYTAGISICSPSRQGHPIGVALPGMITVLLALFTLSITNAIPFVLPETWSDAVPHYHHRTLRPSSSLFNSTRLFPPSVPGHRPGQP